MNAGAGLAAAGFSGCFGGVSGFLAAASALSVSGVVFCFSSGFFGSAAGAGFTSVGFSSGFGDVSGFLLFASALSVHRKQKDKIFLFKNREKQAARFSHDQRIANGRNCDLYTKQFRSCRSEHIVCCTHSSFPVDHRCAAYISALYHHDILLYVLRQSCNADDGKKVLFRVKKHF